MGLLITLNVLDKNGTAIFKCNSLVSLYGSLIIPFCAKYFKNIKIIQDTIRMPSPRYYLILDKYKGTPAKIDTELLISIIESLKNKNFRNTSNDSIIGNLIKYSNYDSDLHLILNKFNYEYNKQLIINKTSYFNFVDTLNNSNIDDLTSVYIELNNQNRGRIIHLGKKYNLNFTDQYKRKIKMIPERIPFIANIEIQEFVLLPPSESSFTLADYSKNKPYVIDEIVELRKKMNMSNISISTLNQKKLFIISRIIDSADYIVHCVNKYNRIDIINPFCDIISILTSVNPIMNYKKIRTMHICDIYDYQLTDGNIIKATNLFLKYKYNNHIINSSVFYNNCLRYFKMTSDDVCSEESKIDIQEIINKMYDKYYDHFDIITSNVNNIDAYLPSFYSQFLIAISCTKIGGTSIFTVRYPLETSIEMSIIYIISHHYEKIIFVKPITTSFASDYIYMVAINKKVSFKKDSLVKCAKYLNNLNNDMLLFNPDENQFFISAVVGIFSKFVKNNINYKLSLIEAYDDPRRLETEYGHILKNAFKNQYNLWMNDTLLTNMNLSKISNE